MPRAITSTTPPAGKGTMIWIGRSGYARAGDAMSRAANSNANRRMDQPSRSVILCWRGELAALPPV